MHKKFTIFFTLLVIIISLVPLPELPLKNFNLNDKLMHLLTYFLLCTSWIRFGYIESKVLDSKYIYFVIIIAVFTEILQGILPINRHFEILDILANLLGIFMSLSLSYLYIFKNKKN